MAINKEKDNSKDTDVDPNVDHGYAWVILAGCFVMYSLVIGTIKAYGILYTEMVSYYGTGSGNTAWIGSMLLLLLLGLSPVANLLSRKFTFRRVAFTGGMLLCLGYFLSGFVQRMEVMFLTLGVCGGLGYGLSFSPCSTIISYYFKKHRALANGIVVSGSGIGALTFPTFYRFLVEKYGLQGAFWIIGGVVLNVCVAACIFRQPRLLLKEKQSTEAKNCNDKDHEVLLNGKLQQKEDQKDTLSTCYGLDFRFSLFKNPQFTMYCVAFILCMNGYGNNLILIPAHIKAIGYDTQHAVYGVTIMGGCEVVARISFGWIADQKLVKRKHIFLTSMFIASGFCFVAPLFNSFVFMGIFSAIIGTFPGSFWSLVSVLIIDVVGIENFTPAFGLVMLCLAFGVVVSQPTIGFLFLFAGLIVAMEPFILRFFKKHETLDDTVDNTIEIPLQNLKRVVTSEETDSLLDENGGVIFTSPRISRIYRPYESEKQGKSQYSSPAPVVDGNEV
ncbi:monocarboxylate transporter 12-like isoform X2 [Mercenaria mercenaria]|uniref:monocarboxylate transporter 12-like isoform X2 n=1 Tax=Mercenaria mercenaria TaxID=6596 RepID=UPI00234E430B|nr:monocarboxylate transporter 12-like isoform X2 [Mercenaria mercenaria]